MVQVWHVFFTPCNVEYSTHWDRRAWQVTVYWLHRVRHNRAITTLTQTIGTKQILKSLVLSQGHLTLETFFSRHNQRWQSYWHLVGRGQECCYNIPQCTGQLLITTNYQAPNISAEAEKPCLKMNVIKITCLIKKYSF